MRELGFQVNFLKSSSNSIDIAVNITSDYSAQEILNDEILDESLKNFGEILSLAKGLETGIKISIASKYQILISASADLLSQPWEIAAMLNMLDGASFLMQDDMPFWRTVEVSSPYEFTLDILYSDLENYLEICRQTMTNLLPENFSVDDYLGRQWPAISGDYMYTVVMRMSSSMKPETQELIDRLLTSLDQLLSESAFEITTSPLEWLEDGMVPYPVEISVQDSLISYIVEMPPSDFGPSLLLVQQILQKNFNIEIVGWDFEIREGW
jgi:hypothetical protein